MTLGSARGHRPRGHGPRSPRSWAPALSCAVLAAAGGCRVTGYYIDYPVNPIPGVHVIAVAPVYSSQPALGADAGDSIAAELVQCPGVERVIRPAEVQRAIEENEIDLVGEAAVRRLARALGADGVLVAEMTEYDPYHPPRIGIVAQLFITAGEPEQDLRIIAASRRGRADHDAGGDGERVVQIERVYDAAHRDTSHRAARYAFGHDLSQEAIAGGERVLWVNGLYLRFVAFSLVEDLFTEFTRRTRKLHEGDGTNGDPARARQPHGAAG